MEVDVTVKVSVADEVDSDTLEAILTSVRHGIANCVGRNFDTYLSTYYKTDITVVVPDLYPGKDSYD